MNPVFIELAFALVAAAAGGLLARALRQPPVLGYLAAGIVLGPLGFHALQSEEAFHSIAELGTALLLFLVGLELDWNRAKEQIGTAFAVSLLQISGSFAAGTLLTWAYTGNLAAALVAGAAISFSSTVLVVRILSGSHDLASLHGRLTVGMLLIQDLVAMVVLAVGTGLYHTGTDAISLELVGARTVAVAACVYVAARYAVPPIFERIARSPELLFVSSLAWCFMVGVFADSYQIPLAIGAFLAGVSLASLPYSLEVVNRLRSLRDVFFIAFFLNLGSSLAFPTVGYLGLGLSLLAVIAVLKPFLAFLLLSARGYKHRTAFLTGSGLGQISEFSLPLIAMGLSLGYLDSAIASSLTFAIVISFFVSAVVLEHRDWWFLRLRGLLHRVTPPRADKEPGRMVTDHIVIFGYHRMGYHILKRLRTDRKHHVMVVDFNPDIIKRLQAQDIDAVYGDVLDEDILPYLQIERAAMVISTVPHKEETLYLIDRLRAIRDDLIIIVTSHQIDEALEYYRRGATYVILPHLLGGERVAELITTYEEGELRKKIAEQAEEVKLLKDTRHALYYE